MAAAGAQLGAQAQPQQNMPELDGRCNYKYFRILPEGKIACLGLGPKTPNRILPSRDKLEISSMAFQKVDTGTVKALLPISDFAAIDWPNGPNTPCPQVPANQPPGQRVPNQYLHNELLLPAPNNVQPQWQRFTTVMEHVKRVMLARMTPVAPNDVLPDSLLQGFQRNKWLGAPYGSRESTCKTQMAVQIEADMGHHWEDDKVLEDWIGSLCDGLCTGIAEFRNLFCDFLYPNCKIKGQQDIAVSPSETSKNSSLANGVVHCLTYGYHNDQLVPARGRARGFHQRPVSHRVLLPKRNRSRSRSRSPISSDDEAEVLRESVEDRANRGYQPLLMNELIDNPDKYVVKPSKLHSFFESHRPDMLLYEVIDPTNVAVRAKIVFEIASYKKFKGSSLVTHLQSNTVQLVQSCLSAFTVNQDLMYGVLVVVDGLKLIKIERRQNQAGTFEYLVSETDLVMWDERNSLNAMFEMINGIL